MIRYEYLWADAAARGREHDKERPCAVVLTVGEGPDPVVYVVPMTTVDPRDPRAIPIRSGQLGLRECWIVPWETNVFTWMGSEVRRAPDPKGVFWRYGALSNDLRNKLVAAVRRELELNRWRRTSRDVS